MTYWNGVGCGGSSPGRSPGADVADLRGQMLLGPLDRGPTSCSSSLRLLGACQSVTATYFGIR